MRNHAKIPIRMWIVSQGHKKFLVYMFFRGSVCCHFKKINEKKTIYRWLYYIPNIKLKIMLCYVKYGWKIYWEVWKFGLEKYGILKWKIYVLYIYVILSPKFKKFMMYSIWSV